MELTEKIAKVIEQAKRGIVTTDEAAVYVIELVCTEIVKGPGAARLTDHV